MSMEKIYFHYAAYFQNPWSNFELYFTLIRFPHFTLIIIIFNHSPGVLRNLIFCIVENKNIAVAEYIDGCNHLQISIKTGTSCAI